MEGAATLLGRYRLRARLGAGGMAEVFRAWQELPGGLRRGVVIKKIRPERLRAPGEAARFREEARVSLGLNHPHIVQVYDYGEEDGQPYLVLEEVTGPSLAALGAALTRQRQLLPPDEALLLAADLAAALDHLHGLCDETGRPAGLVHRDLCASNVLLTRRAEAKLADFGVSRAAGVDQPIEGHLSTMAPEQLAGRAVGPAADLWALGVVLWELLTGQRLLGPEAPSGGRGSPTPDAATWRARLEARLATGPLPAPSSRRAGLPDGIDALVGMLLDPEPRARPSASAAQAELLRLVGPPLLPRLRLAERIAALCPPLPEGEAAEGPPPTDEEAATVVAPAAAERSASTPPPAPAPAHTHTAGSLHQPPRRATLPLAGGAAVLAVVVAVFVATRPDRSATPLQNDAVAVILNQTRPAEGAVAPVPPPAAAPPSALAPPAPAAAAPAAAAPPAPDPAAAPPPVAPRAAPPPPGVPAPAPVPASAAPPQPAPKPAPATASTAPEPAPAPMPPPAPAEAAPALLSVRVEGDFAWFTIDGQRQRKPVRALSLPLTPGRHTVEAELRTSGEVIRKVVELRGGETTSLQIEAPQ
ncbi:MAG: serine/threonine protein kinase [Deltaproteobacteria bacterium]|nr:serine/threonine protein kinase [Deltaproteobacteria bacterium]